MRFALLARIVPKKAFFIPTGLKAKLFFPTYPMPNLSNIQFFLKSTGKQHRHPNYLACHCMLSENLLMHLDLHTAPAKGPKIRPRSWRAWLAEKLAAWLAVRKPFKVLFANLSRSAFARMCLSGGGKETPQSVNRPKIRQTFSHLLSQLPKTISEGGPGQLSPVKKKAKLRTCFRPVTSCALMTQASLV
eukprot:s2055_g19.t1